MGNDVWAHPASSFSLCLDSVSRGVSKCPLRAVTMVSHQPGFVSVTSVSLSGSQSAALSASLNFQLCSSGTPA